MNVEDTPVGTRTQPDMPPYELVFRHRMRQRDHKIGRHPLKLTTKRPLYERPSEQDMESIVAEERLSSEDIAKNNRTLEELRLISLELRQRRDGKVARVMGAIGMKAVGVPGETSAVFA